MFKNKDEFMFYYDVINGICPVCSSELFEDEEVEYHFISCSNCSFVDDYEKYFD